MKKFAWIVFLLPSILFGQITHPNNGVADSKPEYYAIRNVKVIVSPTETIDKATILVKNGRIEEVGKFVMIPKGIVEYDYSGKTILPAFIDLNASIGMPELKSTPYSFRPQMGSKTPGSYYWNESIHPEFSAGKEYVVSTDDNKKYREMGFGAVLTHLNDGVAQGSGAFVLLENDVYQSVLHSKMATFYSFDKGISKQDYPSSQMGSIALIRQAFYDAEWYKNAKDQTVDLSLESLNENWDLPKFFSVEENYEVFRAKKIADEFKTEFVFLGAGDEYAIAKDLKDLKAKVVVSLNFPNAYDVHDPYVSRQIPLTQLQKWELAPYNAKYLADFSVPFCLSANGVKSSDDFWKNVKKMMETGVKQEDVLAALTINPAKWMGIDKDFGTIEKGKIANFTVYDNNPFESKSQVLEAWVKGIAYEINSKQEIDIRGKYNLVIDGKSVPIEIKGTVAKPEGTVVLNPNERDKKTDCFIELSNNDVVIQFSSDNSNWQGSVNLKGKFNSRMAIFEGSGQLPNGKWVIWSGIRNDRPEKDEPKKKFEVGELKPLVTFPMGAYGNEKRPSSQKILINNATVWTNGSNGKMEKSSVLIANGKIAQVGRNLSSDGAQVIDGTGMHITPGIIDEHSHIAISKGVNEGGQTVTAEVSIADVVDPSDINIYRQLSGGVTAAQLLHGSANAIGGQSALIKLKWGETPEGMLITNAPKFIKCALGENVKQANWGDFNTVRFPQTRMGVEQVFYDGFTRAREYEKQKETGNYRKDLELEILLEILKSERFITCHSYVQSEINMLMHVADSMGFKVNTFTHILEGYKVADKMAAHGAGGSTFADWWAYKFEVKDAIPYNAAMMQEQGVVVAINSDDAEMGRRLNQEAAKTVKYGGLSEEDALKLVTLNPAKLLRLDDRMGSIENGKDADVVLWSDHPLSVNARAEITIVDGIIYFDRKSQNEIHERDNAERARILSKMLEANKKGEKKEGFIKKGNKHFHCNTMGEEGTENENQH
ncbi:MAG: amidohydrolase family protein [Bacteroidetes bacterium]|nr:amidohydrolase family protein [Bacteroidota bacterium]